MTMVSKAEEPPGRAGRVFLSLGIPTQKGRKLVQVRQHHSILNSLFLMFEAWALEILREGAGNSVENI